MCLYHMSNVRFVLGIRILRQLACKSDVLVENFVPGKLANYGLDYASLRSEAPHLIYCSITGKVVVRNTNNKSIK